MTQTIAIREVKVLSGATRWELFHKETGQTLSEPMHYGEAKELKVIWTSVQGTDSDPFKEYWQSL